MTKSRPVPDRGKITRLSAGVALGLALLGSRAFGADDGAFGGGFATELGDEHAIVAKAERVCQAHKKKLHEKFLAFFVTPQRTSYDEAIKAGPDAVNKMPPVQVRLNVWTRDEDSPDGGKSVERLLQVRLKPDSQSGPDADIPYEIIDDSDPARKTVVPEESIALAYLDPDCRRPLSLGQVLDQKSVSPRVVRAQQQRIAEANDDIRQALLEQAVQTVVKGARPVSMANPAHGTYRSAEAAGRFEKGTDGSIAPPNDVSANALDEDASGAPTAPPASAGAN